jgi:Mrp family chromosome partitioning ATPase
MNKPSRKTTSGLATITGGAVVVAAAGLVHRQQLADALGSLHDVGAQVLGVVLNRLGPSMSVVDGTLPP